MMAVLIRKEYGTESSSFSFKLKTRILFPPSLSKTRGRERENIWNNFSLFDFFSGYLFSFYSLHTVSLSSLSLLLKSLVSLFLIATEATMSFRGVSSTFHYDSKAMSHHLGPKIVSFTSNGLVHFLFYLCFIFTLI